MQRAVEEVWSAFSGKTNLADLRQISIHLDGRNLMRITIITVFPASIIALVPITLMSQ
jgi:hypothetical protein